MNRRAIRSKVPTTEDQKVASLTCWRSVSGVVND
jgi:hypothetical protein